MAKAAAKSDTASTPAPPSKASAEELLGFYRQMVLIRRFEERAGQLYGMGLIGGFCHLYIGQEAVAVGVQSIAEKGDQVITGYRDHGHMLAGMDPKEVMAELTGRIGGSSKGKGGSMHMFDVEAGFFGGHGIVGAQVSLGHRPRVRRPLSRQQENLLHLFRRRRRATRARCTRASTWPSSGGCRWST